MFPAQLKYWRHKRGLSQLDFSLVAAVSSRHISFLETGRAKPSREMVLRLAGVLAVPLRDQNAMLRAAGYEPRFEEPSVVDMPPSIQRVITLMLEQAEPWPMAVMDHCYDVVQANQSAMRFMSMLVADPTALTTPLNPLRMLFDERLSRPFVRDWEHLAGFLLSRLHQELLLLGDDARLRELIDDLLACPDVPEDWRRPDFSTGTDPVLTFRARLHEQDLAFLVTLTTFNSPGDVLMEELRIESYLPADDVTAAFCREQLAG